MSVAKHRDYSERTRKTYLHRGTGAFLRDVNDTNMRQKVVEVKYAAAWLWHLWTCIWIVCNINQLLSINPEFIGREVFEVLSSYNELIPARIAILGGNARFRERK
jgi:hypothetical protein